MQLKTSYMIDLKSKEDGVSCLLLLFQTPLVVGGTVWPPGIHTQFVWHKDIRLPTCLECCDGQLLVYF